jgi:hypothetical protein
MSRFHGPGRKGASRDVAQQKKTEALERNWQTPDDRRRWVREGRDGPGRRNAGKTGSAADAGMTLEVVQGG